MNNNSFLYGKNTETNIVSIEFKKNEVYIFKEFNGSVKTEIVPAEFYLIYSQYLEGCETLSGKQHFKYLARFKDSQELWNAKGMAKRLNIDVFSINNKAESFMTKNGYTLFKGMQPFDMSCLSFDIETTTLAHSPEAFVLMISNTYRKQGKVIRKLFKYDDYKSQSEMINEWCDWVREMNPTVLLGHNIFGFDLPYLKYCNGGALHLGRDGSAARFGTFDREFRKDGSQTYTYNNVTVFGRQVVDTLFLSIKFSMSSRRSYESFALKNIIKHEQLEKEGRIIWDFDELPVRKILTQKRKGNPDNWDKFCQYCKDDGDDALKLFDLMVPSYFFYTQSIPMNFQEIINRASGAQVNSFMVRSYLQDGHSIAKACEPKRYKGARVDGFPGIYKHVYKVDVASLYPSIIRQWEIYDEKKDPKANFLKMVNVFTDERLSNKAKAKKGDKIAEMLSDAQKIMINSAYGFMGANGLNYNSPSNAELVTRRGREILGEGVEWAESKDLQIVNTDTDSFSFTNGKKIDNFDELIWELNAGYPDKIVWENDGYYKKFIVLKSKNYIMDTGKEIIKKGGSIKDSKKEPILKNFMGDIITLLLKDRKDQIYDLYHQYVFKAGQVDKSTISQWCSKKTVTKAVLEAKRTTEQRIKDAIGNKHVQEGDKIYVFFEDETTLRLVDDYKGKVDHFKLYKRLHDTVKIFENVFDPDILPNYSLTRNKGRL